MNSNEFICINECQQVKIEQKKEENRGIHKSQIHIKKNNSGYFHLLRG